MSIASSRNVNGHATKRRKTSHDSDELPSKSKVLSENSNGATNSSGSEDESEGHADKAMTSPTSVQKPQRPQRSSIPLASTSTSSSTLMLQAQRLLDETRPDHSSRIKKLMPTADRMVGIIKALPDQQPMSYAQAQSYSQKTLRVTIPWTHRPVTDVRYNFHFVAPTTVTLQGPLVQHLTLHDSSAPLVIVPEMPVGVFQEKDYLNYRCLHKRAFFLACVTAALRKEFDQDFDFAFAFPQGNHLSCVLQLSNKSDGKLVYEINPSFPETLGPLAKMTPAHTCIRKHDLADNNTADLSDHTPLYNSTVRRLASASQFHVLIKEMSARADSFEDGCLLAATWLRQRNLSSDVTDGGFGIEEWSLMCALFLSSGGHQGQPLFSPRYSAVQFFKAMLQVLSGRDMHDVFVVRGDIRMGEISGVPVFLDAATGVNVLYKMTPWSYARLKHYATSSLATLNSKKSNGFDATFLTRAFDPAIQYDETYQLQSIASSGSSANVARQDSTLYELLKRGLGDRAHLINIANEVVSPWKITSSTPQSTPRTHNVGILINADTTTRLVDHGPSVEEKEESQAFRSFWGEKAELRKFKDGRICESLVWTADTPVTQQIIHWICQRHLGLSASEIKSSSPLEEVQLRSLVSAEEAFTMVNNKFQALSSTLHHLDGLPLPIRSVTATSELTHSSSLILPLEPGVAQPIDIVILFDSSGRWPDNLQAIQYTKIAFLTKIGDLLTKQDRNLEVRVGIENTAKSDSGIFNTSYLDVINSPSAPSLSPTVFRARIYHERETQLVQQALADKALRPHDREQLQSALQYLKQNFIAAPSHNTAIHSLLTQFPPLSTTIRLLKAWISAHHLSQHIPCEVLEIIAAHVFLFPAPWSVPGTPTLAFTRCLHFLSRWDWSSQPLITDLSAAQDMTLESRNELEARFAAWRQMDPNVNTVTWFVGTNLDTTGVVWTQGIGSTGSRPPRVIASRLTALTSAAINQIQSKSGGGTTQMMTASDWKGIFTSSLDDFDFTIHLNPSILRAHKKSKKAQFKNLQLAASLDVDTTGVDFIQSYIEDLTSAFGHAAIFFYGAKYSGSDVIGGLWRPNLRGKDAKPWKIRLGYSTVPIKIHKEDTNGSSEGMAKVNFEAMLAEIGMMGEGLVEKITVKET